MMTGICEGESYMHASTVEQHPDDDTNRVPDLFYYNDMVISCVTLPFEGEINDIGYRFTEASLILCLPNFLG